MLFLFGSIGDFEFLLTDDLLFLRFDASLIFTLFFELVRIAVNSSSGFANYSSLGVLETKFSYS